MKLFSRINNKRGMTYVELLVALSLLMIIIMAFTPMLLNTYGTIYDAGEKSVEAYDSKSELESSLSIREDDPLVNNGQGIKNKFVSLSNELAIQARRITSDVTGLESLYGVGQVSLRIVSESTLSDNQSFYPIVIRLVNLTPKRIDKGTTWSQESTDGSNYTDKVVVNVKPTFDDSAAPFTTNNYEIVNGTENLKQQTIKIIIKNADISYAPFKISVFYYDEFGQKRIATTDLNITPADIMIVGNTNSDSGFFTTAGVTDGNLLIAGRQILQQNDTGISTKITNGTKINRVRWITTNDTADADPSVGTGTYVMCGMDSSGNAFIRRLWHMDTLNATSLDYSKVSKETNVTYSGDARVVKYVWGADYGETTYRAWIKGDKTTQTLESSKSGYKDYSKPSRSESYNLFQLQSCQNTFKAGTNYLIQLSSPYSSTYLSSYANEKGSFGNGEIVMNYGNNNLVLVKGGNVPNFAAADGYAGINISTTRLRYNPWLTYINYSATGLTTNISGTQTHTGTLFSGKTYSNPTGKAGTATSNKTTNSFTSSSPIIFFASDNGSDATKIDRYFIAANNNWGSQLENMSYGIRTSTKYLKDWVWQYIYLDGSHAQTFLGWVIPNGTSFKDSLHQPRESFSGTKTENGYLIYAEGVSYYHNDKNTGDPYHSTSNTWNSNVNHSCWDCDIAAPLTAQVTKDPLTGASTNAYTIYASDSYNTRRQKIMNLLLNSIGVGSSRSETHIPIIARVTAFTGKTSDGKFDSDGYIGFVRMKSFSNIGASFNTTYNADADKKMYASLFLCKDDNITTHLGIHNSDSAYYSDVELTDVYFMNDGLTTTDNVVYTGVTPVASFIYTPNVSDPASFSSTEYSNCYSIYVIRSYGDDGYTIYQSADNAGHDDYKNKDAISSIMSKWQRTCTNASYTLGYSSNYGLIYNNLTETELDKFNKTTVGAEYTGNDYENKLNNYTKDFYNITTFGESENFLFAVGYRVIGYAGVGLKSSSTTTKQAFIDSGLESYYKTEKNLTRIQYATTPDEFFTSDNFGTVRLDGSDGNSQSTFYYKTKNSNMTDINTTSNSTALTGFYFETRENERMGYVTKYPAGGVAYTTLNGVKDQSQECIAVANTGVIEFMNPGDTAYTELSFNFDSSVPQAASYNYKFTSVDLVKIDGDSDEGTGNKVGEYSADDKLLLVIGASNGYVYFGTLDFGLFEVKRNLSNQITGYDPLDPKANVSQLIADGKELTVRIPDNPTITLYGYKNSAISNIRTVCVKKAEYESVSGSTVTTSTKYYIFASGDQTADSGTKVIAYVSDASTASEINSNTGSWKTITCTGSYNYNIYDIKAIGDYVYAVGANKGKTSGIIVYKDLSTSTSGSWGVKTTYSTQFASAGISSKVTGSDSKALPALYSLASKNA